MTTRKIQAYAPNILTKKMTTSHTQRHRWTKVKTSSKPTAGCFRRKTYCETSTGLDLTWIPLCSKGRFARGTALNADPKGWNREKNHFSWKPLQSTLLVLDEISPQQMEKLQEHVVEVRARVAVRAGRQRTNTTVNADVKWDGTRSAEFLVELPPILLAFSYNMN